MSQRLVQTKQKVNSTDTQFLPLVAPSQVVRPSCYERDTVHVGPPQTGRLATGSRCITCLAAMQ